MDESGFWCPRQRRKRDVSLTATQQLIQKMFYIPDFNRLRSILISVRTFNDSTYVIYYNGQYFLLPNQNFKGTLLIWNCNKQSQYLAKFLGDKEPSRVVDCPEFYCSYKKHYQHVCINFKAPSASSVTRLTINGRKPMNKFTGSRDFCYFQLSTLSSPQKNMVDL